ncbi:hypothetical protein ABBQ32_013655 [Trebouxia sp. C0010 RCD-2024]
MFMDNKTREYLQKQRQAIQADVEATVSHIKSLLSSFEVYTEEAVKVYRDIFATGDTLPAAYTAAIDVAKGALRQSSKADELEKLTEASERSKSLAFLRDHVRDFRIDTAYKMQFCSWAALADELHFERKKASRPTHVLLETTLTNNHVSMKVWNEVREVADADITEGDRRRRLECKACAAAPR